VAHTGRCAVRLVERLRTVGGPTNKAGFTSLSKTRAQSILNRPLRPARSNHGALLAHHNALMATQVR
jgi:hypothetical protein